VGLYYRKCPKIEMKFLTMLFALSFIEGAYSTYCAAMGYKFYWTQHVYTMIEYPLWIAIFYQWLIYPALRRVFLYSMAVFLIICAGDMLIPGHIETINSLGASLACVVYVALASYTLIDLQNNYKGSEEMDYRYLILAALLINSAGSLCYFSFFQFFYSWTIYILFLYLNIGTTVLFTIGMIWLGRRYSLSGA
jgi:hypothetical protein